MTGLFVEVRKRKGLKVISAGKSEGTVLGGMKERFKISAIKKDKLRD